MTRPSRFTTFFAVLFLIASAAAQERPQPAPAQGQPPKLNLDASVPDGFTLSAVGDMIDVRPHNQLADPTFQSLVKIIRGADVAFGNFEGTAFDLAHFKGYPQAESGGHWLLDSPLVPRDMKEMGIDLVSRANNHATDWGVEGMRATDELLDQAGIVHAGTGENLAAATAARYLDTPQGRVAIVSMASSITPMSRASMPLADAPGRPGLNAIRYRSFALVDRPTFEALKKLRDAQPKESLPEPPPDAKPNPNELRVFGTAYRLADKNGGVDMEMNKADEERNLKAIREGKEQADFVIATIHCHEPGNWAQAPPDFEVKLAHEAIDNGADVFIGHGPHQVRGIEIYKGKPIFYSLGNFFFEATQQEPLVYDFYENSHGDSAKQTDAEFGTEWVDRYFKGDLWYQSVLTLTKYEHGQVSEIHLYPVDLSGGPREDTKGLPHMASPQVAKVILERLQKLSEPYGTRIEIQNNVGVIRVK